jgi:hypothetical protein
MLAIIIEFVVFNLGIKPVNETQPCNKNGNLISMMSSFLKQNTVRILVVQWDRLKPPQTSESIFNVEHLSGYKRL